MDCGPTCLRMIARYYGKQYNGNSIRSIAGYNKDGVNLLGISEAAETLGFRTRGVQITLDQLINEAPLPCILHWNQNHFVVMLPVGKKINRSKSKIKIADPGKGILSLTREEFSSHWLSKTDSSGISYGTALLVEPTAAFYEQPGEKDRKLS